MSKTTILVNATIFSLILAAGIVIIYHTKTTNDQAVAQVQAGVIQAKKTADSAASTADLKAILDPLAAANGTNVGVVVTDLSNGASTSANADQPFVSASLYKLFVAYAMYKKIDSGSITQDQSLTAAGMPTTVGDCLNRMITLSDNDCGVALGDLVGWASLDTLLTSEGYTQTMLNNYDARGNVSGDKMTSAHDVAQLLTKLYGGTLLSQVSTDAFLGLLKAQTINDRLPTGLPTGTVIAHKTGDLYGYLHDAGIIYSSKKDVLVVLLTGDWNEPQLEGIPLFTSLASSIWSYMQTPA